jgi:hypothetical protein
VATTQNVKQETGQITERSNTLRCKRCYGEVKIDDTEYVTGMLEAANARNVEPHGIVFTYPYCLACIKIGEMHPKYIPPTISRRLTQNTNAGSTH